LFGSAVVARVFVRDVRRVSRRGRHVYATARARRGTRASGLEVRRERPVALSRSSCVCVCGFAANAASRHRWREKGLSREKAKCLPRGSSEGASTNGRRSAETTHIPFLFLAQRLSSLRRARAVDGPLGA
jgi:hypothetical protein